MEINHQPFPDGTRETDIEQCRISCVLDSSNSGLANFDKRTECWDTAWSHDGELFAWSCGRRNVQIIPTDHLNSSQQQGNVIIDCRQAVTALAFADCRQYRGPSHATPSYRRFQHEKHAKLLAVGLNNGRIRVYDAHTGEILLELIDHQSCVTQLTFAPNNSLVIASSSTDGTVKFWDLPDDGNRFKSFRVGDYTDNRSATHKVMGIMWSPDAKRVAAVGTSKSVILFDMLNCKYLQKLTGHANHVDSCDFSPDGVLLVTASHDSTAIVWNSYTGAVICQLGHQYPPQSEWFPTDDDTNIVSCKFLRSGLQIATVASDGYVRFWDLRNPQCPQRISYISDPLCCSIKPDSDLLSVGNRSGNVLMLLSSSEPPTLSHLCRVASNLLLHRNGLSVDEVSLPLTVKDFLNYDYVEL